MPEILKINMQPVWEQIDDLRSRCEACLLGHGIHPDVAQAVAMVTSELGENAAKYGDFEEAETRGPSGPERTTIDVKVALTPARITVEVRNPVSPEQSEQLGLLDRTIQWIRGFQDPFQAYLERMREVSGQSLSSSESRLGLVRIAYEGQSALDFFVGDDNILVVSATYSR